MKEPRLTSLRDYLAVLARQKHWVLACFMALFALTVLAAVVAPKYYISETLIQVQPREMPTEFVKDLVGSADERLTAIEQTILSRGNLLSICREFADRMPGYRDMNDDRKVAKLEGRIQIEFPPPRRGSSAPSSNVRISCRDEDAELAQKITARLAELFIAQDVRARESQVQDTAEFLAAEVTNVSRELKGAEDRLKELKQAYRYELPAELETNLRTLDRLQVQKTANTEALDRYTTIQLNIERQLATTAPTVPSEVKESAPASSNPMVDAYRKKEQEYRELASRATEMHPDLQRLKSELEQLRQALPPSELSRVTEKRAAGSVPNPAYQSLQAQLGEIRTEIDIRQREKVHIDSEMAKYSGRVQNTPRVEQEIASALRTSEELNQRYQDLKTKLDQARLAQNLETRQKGSQIVVIDPANYPLEPSSPPRRNIALAGLAGALAAGVALALALDALNRKIWNQREFERSFDVPVIVEIPRIVTRRELRKRPRRFALRAALAVVVGAAYLGGLYAMHRNAPALRRALNPVVERIAG